MKLCIISDIHLGSKMYRTEEKGLNKFENSVYKALDKTIKSIKENKPDAILIGGDIFDIPNPDIIALKQFRKMIDELKDFPLYFILGNHDFAFKLQTNETSSLELFMRDNCVLADYDYKIIEKDDCVFFLVPYTYNKTNFWSKIKAETENYKGKKLYLLGHGITKNYNDTTLIKDKHPLEKDVSKLFNRVFLGHIHNPFEEDNVISIGSTVDYQANKHLQGPIYYDTDNDTYTRDIIKTPILIKKTLDENNVNEFLSKVGENIYKLIYKGDLSKIDNDIFLKAKLKAINISFELEKDELEEQEETDEDIKIQKLFDYVDEKYEEYRDIFLRAKEDMEKGT